MKEEIGPQLAKLKQERTQFVEFQRIERELEHCRRIVVAWKYVTALSDSEKAEDDVQSVKQAIEEKEKSTVDGKKEIAVIEKQVQEIVSARESVRSFLQYNY